MARKAEPALTVAQATERLLDALEREAVSPVYWLVQVTRRLPRIDRLLLMRALLDSDINLEKRMEEWRKNTG